MQYLSTTNKMRGFISEYSVDIHGYVLVYSIDSEQSFKICQIIHEKLLDLIGDSRLVLILP